MSEKKQKKKIYKPTPISGFPEWLPEVRKAEQAWFDHIRRVFESYGFCNIETPSVETLDAINAKGGDGGADVDKEVYVLERLHKEENDKDTRLALHFDQTVPFARYTAQHFNDLIFPFKRYQIQRVWRGERPQAGRFREFYQCDIDVINVDTLPLHFDAEMPAIIWETLSSLPGMENEKFVIRISNRKILMGMLENIGITDDETITHVTRCIDKLEKIGYEKTIEQIGSLDFIDQNPNSGLCCNETMQGIISIVNFCGNGRFFNSDDLRDAFTDAPDIDSSNETLQDGIKELSFILDQLTHLPKGSVAADLRIVRGLDYYTGTVYETVFANDVNYGSICSGGRYDDLAGNYIKKHLPGVGISIGFSRLFDRIRTQGKLPSSGVSPADVLVVLWDEDKRDEMNKTAQALRASGHNVETFHSSSKLKRQLAYAEKKGIPYVWFPPFDDDSQHEVKKMDQETGYQKPASPHDWKKDD